MRFTKDNWEKYFDGSNKVMTTRMHKIRLGHHRCWKGNYFKPELIGELDIIQVITKKYKDLTTEDAKKDGFSSLMEYRAEMRRLNGKIKPDKIVYLHMTENVKR